MKKNPELRASIALSAVVFVSIFTSGCIYTVLPAPPVDAKAAGAPLPLRVGVSVENSQRGSLGQSAADALVTALLRSGMFRDVQNSTGGGMGAFDVTVQLEQKPDRTMHSFFPAFLPFCDPLIIGCFPFYSITEQFKMQFDATVSGGKSYSETGSAQLKCQGTLGCAPASSGDPEARASATKDAAAKIAADFVKDAEFYRGLAQSRAAAAAENVPEERPSALESRPAPAPAKPSDKPWWQQ